MDPRGRRKTKSVQKYIWWNYETKILLKLKKETFPGMDITHNTV